MASRYFFRSKAALTLIRYCDCTKVIVPILERNMVPTYTIPYRDGELRIGWASWDDGSYKDRSIKYAYRDASGKISRGSPELPFEVLVDMLLLAADQSEIPVGPVGTYRQVARPLNKLSLPELKAEKQTLTIALMRLQQMMSEIPWATWSTVYDQLGARRDAVKEALATRARIK
jgi:hypothetical protein